MGEVIATIKVMPKDVKVDLTQLEIKIKSAIQPDGMKREPIAFGLVALIITKMIPDAGGELDKIEKKLRDVEGVGEVDITDLTRSL